MQKNKALSIALLLLTISSCEFNQSVKTDLTTGAYSRGDGLSSEDVVIEINGLVEKRNEFDFGEKVILVFNNMSGFKKSDKKVYPGLSLYIIKNEKDTVLSNPNLFENIIDGTDLSPLQLQANFRTALPYQNNEKYKVHVEIWDQKGDGKFTYELPFNIKENDLLSIENNGINYSKIYLWNETRKEAVTEPLVSFDDFLILILEDIEGLKEIDTKVFPIFSMELTDSEGTKIISSSNMLSSYEKEGMDPKDLKNQLTAKMSFTHGEVANPCTLIVKLKDKNSDKEISISSELILK